MVRDEKGTLHLCGFRTSFALARIYPSMTQRIRPRAFLIGPQVAMLPDAPVDIAPADLLPAVSRCP